MAQPLSALQNAIVRSDGTIIDCSGAITGYHVQVGGHQLFNARGQLIGTMTLNGRIYNRDGGLVAQVTRQDVEESS